MRQLKNVVEQIALFEGGSIVDKQVLLHYLPQAAANYSVVTADSAAPQHSYEREREVLFELIHGLHGDVGRLAFGETRHHQQFDPHQAGVDNFTHSDDAASVGDAIDVTHSVVNVEGRTLEETERETIRRSLERNGGRRKATAAELNISERTLYRKIKEFGLE